MENHLDFLNPNEQPETKKTFEDLRNELSKEDNELLEIELDSFQYKIKQLEERNNFFRKSVKRYFEIKKFPMENTSDEMKELHELEKFFESIL
jgi:hypothetical protein